MNEPREVVGKFKINAEYTSKAEVAFRLAIKRSDGFPIRTWRVLQDVKNKIAGADRCAIEIYPSESEVSDVANIYHLWVFEEGHWPKFHLKPGNNRA